MSLDKDMLYIKKLFFNKDNTLKKEFPAPHMFPFIKKCLMNIALGNPEVYAMGLQFSNIGAKNFINQTELRKFKNKDDKEKIKKSLNKLKKTIEINKYVIAKLQKKAEGISCPNYPKKTSEKGPDIHEVTDEELKKIKLADKGKKLYLKAMQVGRGRKRGTKKRRVIKFQKQTRKNRFSQKGGCRFCGNACGFLYSVLADSLGTCLACSSSCRRYRKGNRREQQKRRKTDPTALCCGLTGTEHTFTETETVSARKIMEVLGDDKEKELNRVFEGLMISTIKDNQMGEIIERLTNELIVEDPKFKDVIETMVGQKNVGIIARKTNKITTKLMKKREAAVMSDTFVDGIQDKADKTINKSQKKLRLQRELERLQKEEEILTAQLDEESTKGESKSDTSNADLIDNLKKKILTNHTKAEKIIALLAAKETIDDELTSNDESSGDDESRDEKLNEQLKEESIDELREVVSAYVREYIVKVKDAGKEFRANEADAFQEIFERLELGSEDDIHAVGLNAERGGTALRMIAPEEIYVPLLGSLKPAELMEGKRPHGAMSSRRFYWKSVIVGILKGLVVRTVTQGVQALEQGTQQINEIPGLRELNNTELDSFIRPKVPDAPRVLGMTRDEPYSMDEMLPYVDGVNVVASTTLRTLPLFLGYLTKSGKFYFMVSSLVYIMGQVGFTSIQGVSHLIFTWFVFMMCSEMNDLEVMKSFTDSSKTFIQSSEGQPMSFWDRPTSFCTWVLDVICSLPQKSFKSMKGSLNLVSAETCCMAAEVINGLLTCNAFTGVVESWSHNGRQVKMSETIIREILEGRTPEGLDKLNALRTTKIPLLPNKDYLFRWKDLKQHIQSYDLNTYFHNRGTSRLEVTRAKMEALRVGNNAITEEAKMQMAEQFDAQKMGLRIGADVRDQERYELDQDVLLTQQRQLEAQERLASAHEHGNKISEDHLTGASTGGLADGLASAQEQGNKISEDHLTGASTGGLADGLAHGLAITDSSDLSDLTMEEMRFLLSLPEAPRRPVSLPSLSEVEAAEKTNALRMLSSGGFRRKKSKRRCKRKKKTRRRRGRKIRKRRRKTRRHRKKTKRSRKR